MFHHQASKEKPIDEKAKFAPPSAVSARSDAAPPTAARVTLSVGGMTCASCSNAVTSAVSDIPGVSAVVVNVLGNAAALTVSSPEIIPTVVSAIEDVGYTAEVVSVEPVHAPPQKKKALATDKPKDGPVRVEMSVGGMTCASCVNTVTGILTDIPGVSEVVVNLISNSATAVIPNREVAPQLTEAINDAGYEAEVVDLRPVGSSEEDEAVGPRTVSLHIGGMFCS